MANPTDVQVFFGELAGGTFEGKIGVALSEVAMGTTLHGSKGVKGKLSVEFTFERMNDNDQVMVAHKIIVDRPTKRGRNKESDTTHTAMFVGPGGVLSIAPPRVDSQGQGNFQLVPEKDGTTK